MGKVRCSYCGQLIRVYQPSAGAPLRFMQHVPNTEDWRFDDEEGLDECFGSELDVALVGEEPRGGVAYLAIE